MIKFKALTPEALLNDFLGYIPQFLSEDDPRPAKEQIHANYSHGGGWHRFIGHEFDQETLTLQYPDDPPMRAQVMAKLRNETIYVFQHAWVLILQQDGSWEVARID